MQPEKAVLTGEGFQHLAYQAEDSLAVGIMHITEPLPQLPDKLSALQPVLDLLLAKKPEERYQTGDEMAQALKEYEIAIANGELPSLYAPNRTERDTILAHIPPPAKQRLNMKSGGSHAR